VSKNLTSKIILFSILGSLIKVLSHLGGVVASIEVAAEFCNENGVRANESHHSV
jgi:hypothetical protein